MTFFQFIGHSANANNETFESLDATVSAKRRKIGEHRDEDLLKNSDNKDATGECGVTGNSILTFEVTYNGIINISNLSDFSAVYRSLFAFCFYLLSIHLETDTKLYQLFIYFQKKLF